MKKAVFLPIFAQLGYSKIGSSALVALAGVLFLALTPTAMAQATINLPLASVTNQSWFQNAEELRLVVPPGANQPLNLDVYSPGLNLNDYANGRALAGYYGDELYSKDQPLNTIITLLDAANTKVLERRYGTGTLHSWERLWASSLPAGIYRLRVTSQGNGKNAFAVRVAAAYRLESASFTVNARGKVGEDLLAAKLVVGQEWLGKRLNLTNYDGDGASELELELLTPDGQRRKLPVSANGQSITSGYEISGDLVGEWSIIAKIPASAKQFSNAFGLKTSLDNQPIFATLPAFVPPPEAKLIEPLVVEVLDGQGRAVAGASYQVLGEGERSVVPIIPRGYAAQSATVLEGTGRVVSPSEARISSGRGKLRFVVRQLQGTLSIETVALVGNTRLPLTGIPLTVAGQTLKSPATLVLAVGDYTIKPTNLPDSTVESKTGTVADGQTARVVLEYRVQAALTLLVNPDVVDHCGQASVSASTSSNFPYSIAANLRFVLASGLKTNDILSNQGEIGSGRGFGHQVRLEACSSGGVSLMLEPFGLTSDSVLRVRPPAGLSLVRVMGSGQGLRLTKTLSQVSGGYSVMLTLVVERLVENVRLSDPLPAIENAAALRPVGASLRSAGQAPTNLRFEGAVLNLGRLAPATYFVSYDLFTDLAPAQVVTVPEIAWDEVIVQP
jgi:hypothetical protein